MRILSVRGKNLASLEEFHLDLAEGPIGRAGLFAITGPTGAGKSTILDAICVALFDKTPRLSEKGGAVIGREGEEDRLPSNDVRSLLRRGAGSGFAEVVFVGKDGIAYRARWAVRKARESSTGRFQDQTVELRNAVTDQQMGRTKSETLERIQELVGLNYEQFCRSVLLAQGDFAAFLKAGERERSDLLERVTGTQIYGKISMAAFRRMREEEQLLADLDRQRNDIALLTAEERREAEEGLASVNGDLERLKGRMDEIEKAQGWYQQRQTLSEAVEAARTAKEEADRKYLAGEEGRRELAGIEQAQGLRPLVQEADGAAARAADAARAAGDQQTKLARLAESQESGKKELAAVEERAQAVDDELAAARPLIAKAIELDTRLAQAASLAESSRREYEVAATAAAETGKEVAVMAEERETLDAELKLAEEKLEHFRPVAPLAAEWNRWQQELQRYVAVSAARQEAFDRRQTLLDDEDRLAGEAEAAAGKVAQALEAESSAKQALEEAERAASVIDPTVLTAQRQELDARRDALTLLAQLNREAVTALADRGRIEDEARQAREEEGEAGRKWRQDQAEREKRQAALEEAERALKGARAAATLEDRRAELADGEPCPLCGSLDHPWSSASPVAAILDEQERRVAELRETVAALGRSEGAGREREAQMDARARELTARAELVAKSLTEREEAWKKNIPSLSGLGLPESPAAPEAEGTLAAERVRVDAQLGDLLASERALQETARTARSCRERCDGAVVAREKAAEAKGRTEKSLAETVERRKGADRDLARTEKEIAGVLAVLAEPFAGREGWEAKLANDPQDFVTRCGAVVAEWNQWSARRDGAKEALAALDPKLAGARGRLEGLSREEAGKLENSKAHAAAFEQVSVERRGCFDGRPVEAVERELGERQRNAHSALQVAREEAERRGREVAGAEQALATLKAQLSQAESAAAAARSQLSAELARQGLEEGVLRQRLGHDHSWIVEERERLLRLEKEAHTARTVVEERERSLRLHEESTAPSMPVEEVAAERDAALDAKKSLDQQLFEIRHRLQSDDTARVKAAELLPRIEAQARRCELWQGISEVIGSADGKKFRTYAQSLTLELLLGYANEHLASLAPRYAVTRVPSSEMELQIVDRDMGDEIRSVNSLSGGESFLVSLALALGLSSLSSASTTVESLFIDEGFGSLDQDTLEVALATLDSLQASGRKVGIISHVPGLAERIGARIEVVPLGGGRSRVQVR
ncbi:AAA family ATPase [Geomonas sp. Red32]|uniref:AAA family ATPase n=1 Tax=Geomonas sp. Red32 TaxID=2912856 RepID=UPI00202CEFBF|nr:AAA family ATPase [Geomonas sp. Red32]MCM0083536.1 AAA family ATPase [Geomonas sp. Red32]